MADKSDPSEKGNKGRRSFFKKTRVSSRSDEEITSDDERITSDDAFVAAVDSYFSGIDSDQEIDAALGNSKHSLLHSVLQRDKYLNKHLKNKDAFAKYVETQSNSAEIRQEIQAVVSRMSTDIQFLESTSEDDGEYADLSQRTPEEQFFVLATEHFLDPGTLFPDQVDETPTICDFSKMSNVAATHDLLAAPEAVQAFGTDFARAQELFSVRWRRLTGKSFKGGVPWVGDLLRKKSSVPCMPSWTSALESREARAMNAEPNGDRPGGNEGDADGIDDGCDANAILTRLGIPALRPPSPNAPRYTFPGQLLQREDIFYDYGLVIPVDECGPLKPSITAERQRSIAHARIIAAEIEAILNFLADQGFSKALGEYPNPAQGGPATVVEAISGFLNNMLGAINPGTARVELEHWKSELRSLAAIVRAAARRRLISDRLFAGVNPTDLLANLDAAINGLPSMQRYWMDSIEFDPDDARQARYLEVNGRRVVGVRDIYGNSCIDNNEQVRTLKPYLNEIQGNLFTAVDELVKQAQAMHTAVDDLKESPAMISPGFRQAANETINEMALAISRMLLDIAESISTWGTTWAEGSKRLGLLVVFRQYWTPEGYVKGKLVGYKNLLPDQTQKFKRRTFVQTTTERSSLQEFSQTRQEDFSQSRKETSEIVKENAWKFNTSISASGGFDILIGSLDVAATTAFETSNMSRATQNAVAEMAMKSAMTYNEKREVKIREETKVEEEFESTEEISNPNQEITANYFYYQLLRQYSVHVELNDIRPVLLRTKHTPTPSEVDEKWLADNAHVLVNALPAQLSFDMTETVNDIEAIGREMLLAQAMFDQQLTEYNSLRQQGTPASEEAREKYLARVAAAHEAVKDSRADARIVRDRYDRMRVKIDRVLGHVRKNICHYMQFVWQSSPKTDEDKLLREEGFGGYQLPLITRGLQRQGYFGNEEIFDFTGPSFAIAEALSRVMIPGSEFSGISDQQLRATRLFQHLARFYTDEELDDVISKIRQQNYLCDPANPSETLSTRRVQVAQDALVVETMPGQIPLLEAFKRGHRAIDLENACLQNQLLRARIEECPCVPIEAGEE